MKKQLFLQGEYGSMINYTLKCVFVIILYTRTSDQPGPQLIIKLLCFKVKLGKKESVVIIGALSYDVRLQQSIYVFKTWYSEAHKPVITSARAVKLTF